MHRRKTRSQHIATGHYLIAQSQQGGLPSRDSRHTLAVGRGQRGIVSGGRNIVIN
ncbi:hypothetical protein P4544_13860 [Halomonas sp. LY9]